jgi:hypothetical protein
VTTTDDRQLHAVLAAARNLLGARQDGMVTIDEWLGLARAVAACTGGKTTDLLTDRDLEEAGKYTTDWNPAVDGPPPCRREG